MIDIGMLEHNTIVLKKTIKYLNGEVKTIVERRIKENYEMIDSFFDDLNEEHESIQSYEQDKYK